jgi:hypothetical protein
MILITKILGAIKAYWLIGLGALVGGLMLAVKVLAGRNSRLSTKLETADAKIHHAKVVAQKKVVTEKERVDGVTQAKMEIDEHGFTKELSEKDEDW